MSFFFFLSKFDLFRLPISFLYDKNPTHSTGIGVLFSFSIYAFMIFTFSQSDVFVKKSPVIISQTLSNKYADPIYFSNSTIIGFQLSDKNQNFYYDPSIFSIQLRRLVFGRNKYGVTVPLNQYFEILRPCVQEDSAFDPEMFENSGMKGSFCLNNKTFSIYGQITEQNYSFFSVAVFPCDNLTSKNNCKSKEEINNFLSNGKYLTMAMHNSIINVEDYENPMKVSYKGIITSLDINLSKTSFIYIKKNILKSDDGFFFEETRNFQDFTFDHQEQDINLKSENQSYISYTFFASTNFDKTQRRYQKIQEMLGSFSGTTQFIMFFYFIITNFILRIETMKKILNNLFIFQTINKSKKKKNNRKRSGSDQKIDKSLKIIKNEISSNDKIEFQKIEMIEDTNRNLKIIDDINSDLVKPEKNQNQSIIENEKKNFRILTTITNNNDNNKLEKKELKDEDIELNLNNLSKIINIEKPKSSNSNLTLKLEPSKKDYILENLNEKKSDNKFDLNFFEYFRFKLSSFFNIKKSEKQKLIERAESSFIEQMDILNILSKIQEIEKLKLVLLNDDQLFLFNLLAKPKIYVDAESIQREISRSSVMSQRIINYKSPREKEKTISTYEQVVNNAKKDEINQRILNLINDEFNY